MSNAKSKRAYKSKKRSAALPTTRNTRLTAQTRKQLGKHYASKYQTR